MLSAFTSPSTSIHHMPMADTMSLAILPSTPMAHTSSHQHPASLKRPKLSLNTSNVPSSFGKKSTSLRLETLSTTSPTSRNTFSNALVIPQGITGLDIQQSPSTHLANETKSDQQERRSSPTDTVTSSYSASSASTIESSSGEPPYRLSYTLTSVLKNGPIPRELHQKTSFGLSKPAMFPATKKVAFRTPLEEEVKTTKYTLRHIDIESSTSTISTLELSPIKKEEAQPCDSATEDDQKPSKSVVTATKKFSSTPQTGDKRESSDEEDSDTGASTPIAGRRKRSRRWVWTLPAVNSSREDGNVESKHEHEHTSA